MRDITVELQNGVEGPFPKQQRMLSWFLAQPKPEGYSFLITTEGALSFIPLATA